MVDRSGKVRGSAQLTVQVPANDTVGGEESVGTAVERICQLIHDLRNPVGAVGMAVEILKDPLAGAVHRLPPDSREQVDNTLSALGTSAEQLRHVIELLTQAGTRAREVLSTQGAAVARPVDDSPVLTTQVEARPLKPQATEVGLRDLLNRLEILTVTRSAKPAMLAVQVDEEDLSVVVNGPELLRGLSNLVENAIEASALYAPDAEPWTVQVRAHVCEGRICIDVSNRGYPLTEGWTSWLGEDAGAQTEPPASSKEEAGMHGLGLSSARRVAESYGGSLAGHSANGITTLGLQFPDHRMLNTKAS